MIPHQTGSDTVRELGVAYQRLGCQVVYGSENLIECNLQPDLVHLHWPEEHYRWHGEGSTAARIQTLKKSLDHYRQANVPLCMTVHNLAPHDHFDNPLDQQAYQHVISASHLLHHHCPASVDAIARRYKVPADCKQVVVPLGHYQGYANTVSRQAARATLELPQDAFVYLQFGQVRGYKGLRLMLAAFDRVKVAKKYLLVAGRYAPTSSFKGWVERIQLNIRKRFGSSFTFHGYSIDADQIQNYLNAADCLVLSHTAGLNSGVAVLGMTFGLPVIGPRLGCIDWVLQQGANLPYAPGDLEGLVRQMTQAAQQSVGAFEINKRVSHQWRWEHVAQAVLTQLVPHHPLPAVP